MSKQTKNTHSVPSAASGLTHSATGQAPEHRTKYTYDKLGQVTSGKRVWQDGTPVAGQQYEYTFDDIGNRKSASMGGDASWGPLRQARYDNPNPPNRLNQYAQREVPAAVDILGIANPTEPVTVNGNTAYRKGEYFDYTLSTPNGTAPWDNTVTVQSDYGAGQTSSGSLFVPKSPEQFAYDADGNLTQDGRWNYTWDAENRLVELEPASSVADAKLVFDYDAMGRRIRKQVWNNAQESGGPDLDQRFLYDGWNLFVVLDYPYFLEWFVWGLDSSGSLQGAGGVGGLLMETTYLPSTATSFAAYDGNGNVMALLNADDGSFSAQYEYGPFGELLRATGPVAKVNPLRFSTKYQDDETDLLYYGYRYYSSSLGRWTSRDPSSEMGSLPYVFLGADAINRRDVLGLDDDRFKWVPGQFTLKVDVKLCRTCWIHFPSQGSIDVLDPKASVHVSIGWDERLVSATITKDSGQEPGEVSSTPPSGYKWVPESTVYDKIEITGPEPAGSACDIIIQTQPFGCTYCRWEDYSVKVDWRRQAERVGN